MTIKKPSGEYSFSSRPPAKKSSRPPREDRASNPDHLSVSRTSREESSLLNSHERELFEAMLHSLKLNQEKTSRLEEDVQKQRIWSEEQKERADIQSKRLIKIESDVSNLSGSLSLISSNLHDKFDSLENTIATQSENTNNNLNHLMRLVTTNLQADNKRDEKISDLRVLVTQKIASASIITFSIYGFLYLVSIFYGNGKLPLWPFGGG